MNTSWNDAEEDALHGLPWMAQLVYLRGLRRFMDYRTGVVGVVRGVSRQSLTETVYVEHVQGRHTPKDTSDKAVRAAIEALIRAGLIERTGDAKRLIFKLPLADSDESVQNMRGRRGADEGPTRKGREESSNDNASDDMRGRRGAVAAPAMKGPPPYTDIREEKRGTIVPLSGKPDDAGPDRVLIVLDHLNAKAGTSYSARVGSKPTRAADLVRCRLAEHGQEALIAVIDRKTAEWLHDDHMRQFLRPTTLFGREKCAEYVGQLATPMPRQASVGGHNRAVMDEWLSGHNTFEGTCTHD